METFLCRLEGQLPEAWSLRDVMNIVIITISGQFFAPLCLRIYIYISLALYCTGLAVLVVYIHLAETHTHTLQCNGDWAQFR